MYTHARKYSHPIPLSVTIHMHPYCFLAAAACYGYEWFLCVHILDSLGIFHSPFSISPLYHFHWVVYFLCLFPYSFFFSLSLLMWHAFLHVPFSWFFHFNMLWKITRLLFTILAFTVAAASFLPFLAFVVVHSTKLVPYYCIK